MAGAPRGRPCFHGARETQQRVLPPTAPCARGHCARTGQAWSRAPWMTGASRVSSVSALTGVRSAFELVAGAPDDSSATVRTRPDPAWAPRLLRRSYWPFCCSLGVPKDTASPRWTSKGGLRWTGIPLRNLGGLRETWYLPQGAGQPGLRGPEGLTRLGSARSPGTQGDSGQDSGSRWRRQHRVWELLERLVESASGPGRGGKLTPGRGWRHHSSKTVGEGLAVDTHLGLGPRRHLKGGGRGPAGRTGSCWRPRWLGRP